MKRLHLGCGRTILPDWVNLDVMPGPGVDVVADLDDCANQPLPFANDTFDEFLGSHLLEHIYHTLPLMQELHRIAKPGAKAVFKTPYGSSDNAFEDPTHVRLYFVNSFGYFSQPFYWRADYGYRGDWQPRTIALTLPKERYEARPMLEVQHDIKHLRNVVREMTAELIAMKPARPPQAELQIAPQILLQLG